MAGEAAKTRAHGTSARSLRLDRPDVLALGDGSFLLVTANAVYHVDGGRARHVVCADQLAADRDPYLDGRPATRAAVQLAAGASHSPLATTDDGSLLVAADGYVAMIPSGRPGRRFAAALPAENLVGVPAGRIVVELTRPAGVRVIVRRHGRTVETVHARLGAGRHALRLPRRLGAGEHQLTLRARTRAGDVAVDALGVLGTHQLDTELAQRIVNRDPYRYVSGEDGLNLNGCRQRTPLHADCRLDLLEPTTGDVDKRRRASVDLRRDGELELHSPPAHGAEGALDFILTY